MNETKLLNPELHPQAKLRLEQNGEAAQAETVAEKPSTEFELQAQTVAKMPSREFENRTSTTHLPARARRDKEDGPDEQEARDGRSDKNDGQDDRDERAAREARIQRELNPSHRDDLGGRAAATRGASAGNSITSGPGPHAPSTNTPSAVPTRDQRCVNFTCKLIF